VLDIRRTASTAPLGKNRRAAELPSINVSMTITLQIR
jgi:hypothetical protein